jgi:ElaB/YqjD/DUF883 family membrane-anchored ribosome-binding protein
MYSGNDNQDSINRSYDGGEPRTRQGFDTISSQATGIGRSVSESAEKVTSRAKDYLGDTSQELQSQGRRAQNQLQRMLEDSPLLVGAGALMIGAAFGFAVPETETENQLMGEARNTVMERTQEMAKNAASQVQEAAGGLTDAITKQQG